MAKNESKFKGYDNIFAVRLRKLLKETGTTQQVLAEKTNCTRQAIAQYIGGLNAPNVDKLVNIAQFFDVSTDYLLGLTNASTTNTNLKSICNYTGLDDEAIYTLHTLNELINNFEKTVEELKIFEEYLSSITADDKLFYSYFINNRKKIDAFESIKLLLFDYYDNFFNTSCEEKRKDIKDKIIKACDYILSFYNSVIYSARFQSAISNLVSFNLLYEEINVSYEKNPLEFRKKAKSNRFGDEAINRAWVFMYEAREDFYDAIKDIYSDNLRNLANFDE